MSRLGAWLQELGQPVVVCREARPLEGRVLQPEEPKTQRGVQISASAVHVLVFQARRRVPASLECAAAALPLSVYSDLLPSLAAEARPTETGVWGEAFVDQNSCTLPSFILDSTRGARYSYACPMRSNQRSGGSLT